MHRSLRQPGHGCCQGQPVQRYGRAIQNRIACTNLTKEQEPFIFGGCGKAVICALRADVSKVNTLPKLRWEKVRGWRGGEEEEEEREGRMKQAVYVVLNTAKVHITIYPVEGASGGAIRRPWLNIPTQFVSLDPCHSSCLNHIKGSVTSGCGEAVPLPLTCSQHQQRPPPPLPSPTHTHPGPGVCTGCASCRESV